MQQIIKKILGFVVCLMVVSCPSDACTEYQDIAIVTIRGDNAYESIDSVAIKTNDSIMGCGEEKSKMLGSKTHNVKFPINIQVQLFVNGEEKELYFEMSKNTILKFYAGDECLEFSSISKFDDFCWVIVKIDKEQVNRCVEYSVQGKGTPCSGVGIGT